VLFPGQLLPLHIFEPRYRQMIGECIQHGQAFGVVLIRSGEEVGGMAEPYSIGTSATIVQVEQQSDVRMHIVCVGNARFRIEQLYRDKPYLYGAVQLWPWEPFVPGSANVERVRRQTEHYLRALAELSNNKLDLELPADPAALANIAASVLQIDSSEKQELLTTVSIGALLAGVSDLLQRELRAWQIVHASRQLSSDEAASFSLN
jgi:Lon protease-like protein